MKFQLHGLSISGESMEFKASKIPYEYEINFDNCVSTINLERLLHENGSSIIAESFWPETGERFKDNVVVTKRENLARFPEKDGYRSFFINWTSSSAIDSGVIVIKLNGL